jgi:hypothetical protein
MKATLLRYPSEEDWLFAKQCALVTVNKTAITPPDLEWKHKILRAKHSPIRVLEFAFDIELPYWVSVHLARHVHAQPFIRTQRNDRQNEYDRRKAPQDAPVRMIFFANAEELMTIAQKRLCKQASEETRKAVQMMCDLVLEKMPEFDGLFAPPCVRYGRCDEMFPCGGVNNGT